MEYQTHEHDVLVIGAGGAGLRAAIEACTPDSEPVIYEDRKKRWWQAWR